MENILVQMTIPQVDFLLSEVSVVWLSLTACMWVEYLDDVDHLNRDWSGAPLQHQQPDWLDNHDEDNRVQGAN